MHASPRTVRRGCGLAAALVGGAIVQSAHAQLGTTIGVDSDYRYRGVTLSHSNPSPRLTLNFDGADRWYAGASATRAALLEHGTYAQLTAYAGWLAGAAGGASVELGALGSHFVGNAGYDFAEAYVGLLAREWSARVYFSPDYYGRDVATAYAELNAHVALDERSRAFAHVGTLVPLQSIAGDAGKARADLSVGAGIVVRGWDLHALAVAATRGGPYPAVYNGRRAAGVVGAAFSF
ncbi:MAG: hypothetical protein JO090_03490 [Rhizobacter sp.]|nr:hypothetical protein [Rhizobacter sp.]